MYRPELFISLPLFLLHLSNEVISTRVKRGGFSAELKQDSLADDILASLGRVWPVHRNALDICLYLV